MTAASKADVELVVGLGNPGADYVMTRHNAGFWLVDLMARQYGATFKSERKFQGELARTNVEGRDVRLFKPMTYMNRSGIAVQSVAAYLKLMPSQILVVHDDLDLPAGTVRLKVGGGHGGHNGLRDLIRHLGADFRRLRIGIGHPGDSRQVVNYVLKRASSDDEQAIMDGISEALSVMPDILSAVRFERAQQRLHSAPAN
ncbi:MAG: aminoacyl-tRNA hydrolase [Gammaproteobacteria bacterium]|jgi:PTH1 family peptidyl-tRNA hydrolase